MIAPSLALRHVDAVAQLVSLTPAARAGLEALPLRILRVTEGVDLVREGDRPNECCLVLEGLVCGHKIARGGQRQILSFHLAGEIPDLHSLHCSRMDHSIVAMTAGRVAYVSHGELQALADRFPEVASAFLKLILIDAAIARETIANIGRRSAFDRTAHLFCEMYTRMSAKGLAEGLRFELPLSQASLAEALGLSAVHVNRTLQQLRREGLIASRGRYVTILDWDRLRQAGDFDPSYLRLQHN